MQLHLSRNLLLLTIVVLFYSASPLLAVEIIAHRGASHDAPENTLAAFKLGWEQRADADELDIYLTKDGQIVVIHDADTKRTTGVSGAVRSRTLAELRRLDAGSWKGAKWKGERLPTLAEALETVPEGKRMFIEIKCGPEVLPILERVLRASGKKPEQLVLIGFRYATMEKARKRFPKLPIYWLAGYEADKRTGEHPDIETLVKKAKSARFDGLNLDFKFPVNPEFVSKVKGAGLRLYVWTVDDPAAAASLAEAGVDGITTNRPGWLRRQLK
jgi:glycerophosphoryl diester phosphodiesterase